MRTALFLLSLSLSLATCSEAGVIQTSNFLPQNVRGKSASSRLATVTARAPVIVSMQGPTSSDQKNSKKTKGLKADYTCPSENLCISADGTVHENSPRLAKDVQERKNLEMKSKIADKVIELREKMSDFKIFDFGPDFGNVDEEPTVNKESQDLTIEGRNLNVEPEAKEVEPLPLPKDAPDANDDTWRTELELDWTASLEDFYVQCYNWHDKLTAEVINHSEVKRASRKAFLAYREMKRIESLAAKHMEDGAVEKQEGNNVEGNGLMDKLKKGWAERRESKRRSSLWASDSSLLNSPKAHPFGLDPDVKDMINWAFTQWAEQSVRGQLRF